MTIEQKIEKLKQEKVFLQWFIKLYESERKPGHQQRTEHLKAMNLLPVFEKPKVYDLYYITSDKLIGEDFVLWNYPNLWIRYKFGSVV